MDIKEELEYYKQINNELETIFEMAFDQITVADGNGVFLRISKSCEENFGWPREKILGSSAYDLEKHGVFSRSATVAVLEEKQEVTLIQETLGKKKLMVTGKPMHDEKGNIYRVINISKDITELETLKNELKDTEDVLKAIREQLVKQNTKPKSVLIGNSEAMKPVMNFIDLVAPLNTTVLIQGETGVGKSVFARRIHDLGPNKDEPFIHINCGAIPSELLESELFGYVSGAFTSASKKGKEGLLTAAKNGTIFLDEISEMSLPLQVKLLHVLQEKHVMKLGDTVSHEIKAKIITAANKDLKDLVKQGKFREDLYYRLSVVPITIPPLRERKDDITLLVQYFTQKMNERYNLHKYFSDDALKKLMNYSWPGNVRELENTVERLIIMTPNNTIEENDIDKLFRASDMMISNDNNKKTLPEILADVEKKVLLVALKEHKTTRQIGEALGIDQSTVVKKLKKYDLKN